MRDGEIETEREGGGGERGRVETDLGMREWTCAGASLNQALVLKLECHIHFKIPPRQDAI